MTSGIARWVVVFNSRTLERERVIEGREAGDVDALPGQPRLRTAELNVAMWRAAGTEPDLVLAARGTIPEPRSSTKVPDAPGTGVQPSRRPPSRNAISTASGTPVVPEAFTRTRNPDVVSVTSATCSRRLISVCRRSGRVGAQVSGVIGSGQRLIVRRLEQLTEQVRAPLLGGSVRHELPFAEERRRKADTLDDRVAVAQRQHAARSAERKRGTQRPATDARDANLCKDLLVVGRQRLRGGQRLRQLGILQQRRRGARPLPPGVPSSRTRRLDRRRPCRCAKTSSRRVRRGCTDPAGARSRSRLRRRRGADTSARAGSGGRDRAAPGASASRPSRRTRGR